MDLFKDVINRGICKKEELNRNEVEISIEDKGFIINRHFSLNNKSCLAAIVANKHSIPEYMLYDFYRTLLRRDKYYCQWYKKDDLETNEKLIKIIKKITEINNKNKIIDILPLITDEIKKELLLIGDEYNG